MKNYLFLFALSSFVACKGEVEQPKELITEILDSTEVVEEAITIDTVETSTSFVEDTIEAAISLEEVLLIKKECFVEQKNDFDALTQKEERYVEGLPFKTFLGLSVEIGELEITAINNESVRVHVDYFDGSPIGGKRFWVDEGNLVAIEVVKIEEAVTENGSFMKDYVSHVCYYDNDELLEVWDAKNSETMELSGISWSEENLSDWELVKASL